MRLGERPVPNVFQGVPLQGCVGRLAGPQGPQESTGQRQPGKHKTIRACELGPGVLVVSWEKPTVRGFTVGPGIAEGVSAKEYRTHNTC